MHDIDIGASEDEFVSIGGYEAMTGELWRAVSELEEEKTLALVAQLLRNGADPLSIVEECREGLEVVGDRYSRGQYFLSDLIMSGEIFKEVMALLEPVLTRRWAGGFLGRLVIGTVKGDIHDLGKSIVVSLLKCSGVQVFDLGVDVSPREFVDALIRTQSEILGLSALMTPSFEWMKETVDMIRRTDILPRVTVLIGGLVNEAVRRYVGADYYCLEAREGVNLCLGLCKQSQVPAPVELIKEEVLS